MCIRDSLKAAEVLVYDRLGSEELLTLVPEDCERIYVGKEAGHHIKKQSEINRILVEKALEGKRVVRLKGGDPFVFGRDVYKRQGYHRRFFYCTIKRQ